jgi:hypothetical protein
MEAARILKRCVAEVPIVRPLFGTASDAPVEALVDEAKRYPVSRALPATAEPPTAGAQPRAASNAQRYCFSALFQVSACALRRS